MPRRYGTIWEFQGSVHEDDLDGKTNHEGRPADVKKGVVYIGPYEDPHAGFPEHVRRCARSLDGAGVPINLRSVDPRIQISTQLQRVSKDRHAMEKRYKDLLDRSIQRPVLEIYQIVPHDEMICSITRRGAQYTTSEQLAAINRCRIIYTVWERDRCSQAAAVYLSHVGQCWVANHQDMAMLERSGVPREKLRVVPIPYLPEDPHLALNGRDRLPGPVRFYHIGKWEPRKDQHGAIGAFLLAFNPGEARFILKTSVSAPDLGEYPRSPEESVHRWLKDPKVISKGWTLEKANKSIKIIKRHISDEQLLELHRIGDVYVTLSRGEGFDMPAFDAKLSGNLMVYTPSGGPQDFAGEADMMVSSTGNEQCHPFYRWGDACYLTWSLEEASDQMKIVRNTVLQGGRRRGVDLDPFTSGAVGDRMRQYVEEATGGPIVEG